MSRVIRGELLDGATKANTKADDLLTKISDDLTTNERIPSLRGKVRGRHVEPDDFTKDIAQIRRQTAPIRGNIFSDTRR